MTTWEPISPPLFLAFLMLAIGVGFALGRLAAIRRDIASIRRFLEIQDQQLRLLYDGREEALRGLLRESNKVVRHDA